MERKALVAVLAAAILITLIAVMRALRTEPQTREAATPEAPTRAASRGPRPNEVEPAESPIRETARIDDVREPAATNEPVPESVIRDCLEQAILAPNSSNLQIWEFY